MSESLQPVLAAEDEESDRFILQLSFKRAGITNPLVTVCDGTEAVAYLAGNAPFEDRAAHPLPALLLLDLKMPRMTGFDVLDWLATRREFKEMPVVILSSSSHDSDIQRARQMGAWEYFVKPHAVSDLVEIIQNLQRRWLCTGPGETSAFSGTPAASSAPAFRMNVR